MYWTNDNLEFNVKSKSKRYWKIVLDILLVILKKKKKKKKKKILSIVFRSGLNSVLYSNVHLFILF